MRWGLNLALALTLLLLESCVYIKTESYTAPEITLKFIDAETKKVIPGVMVVADWEVTTGYHSYRIGTMQVLEGVSDENGIVNFEAWGPKENIFFGGLDLSAPAFYVFKDEFRYKHLIDYDIMSRSMPDPEAIPVADSIWNGRTIELKRADRETDYARLHVSDFQSSLSRVAGRSYNPENPECLWTKLPRSLLLIEKMRQKYEPDPEAKTSVTPFDRLPIDKNCRIILEKIMDVSK